VVGSPNCRVQKTLRNFFTVPFQEGLCCLDLFSKAIRPDMCPQIFLLRKPTGCLITAYKGLQVLRELCERMELQHVEFNLLAPELFF